MKRMEVFDRMELFGRMEEFDRMEVFAPALGRCDPVPLSLPLQLISVDVVVSWSKITSLLYSELDISWSKKNV